MVSLTVEGAIPCPRAAVRNPPALQTARDGKEDRGDRRGRGTSDCSACRTGYSPDDRIINGSTDQSYCAGKEASHERSISAAAAGRFTFPGTSISREPHGLWRDAACRPACLRRTKDPEEARAVLREALALGIDHIDTSDYYGPYVTNRLIREALFPYPDGTRRSSPRSAPGATTRAAGSSSAARLPAEVRRRQSRAARPRADGHRQSAHGRPRGRHRHADAGDARGCRTRG